MRTSILCNRTHPEAHCCRTNASSPKRRVKATTCRAQSASANSPTSDLASPPGRALSAKEKLALLDRAKERRLEVLSQDATSNPYKSGAPGIVDVRLYQSAVESQKRLSAKLSEANAHAANLERRLDAANEDLRAAADLLQKLSQDVGSSARQAQSAAAAFRFGADPEDAAERMERLGQRLEAVHAALQSRRASFSRRVPQLVPLTWVGPACEVRLMGDWDDWTRGVALSAADNAPPHTFPLPAPSSSSSYASSFAAGSSSSTSSSSSSSSPPQAASPSGPSSSPRSAPSASSPTSSFFPAASAPSSHSAPTAAPVSFSESHQDPNRSDPGGSPASRNGWPPHGGHPAGPSAAAAVPAPAAVPAAAAVPTAAAGSGGTRPEGSKPAGAHPGNPGPAGFPLGGGDTGDGNDGVLRRFEGAVALLPGRYAVKFLVDGEWRLAADWPTQQNELGETNNILIVQ